MTGLELLKAPEATAGEIADIISAPCPPVIPAHCDGVSCRACWLAWLTGEPLKGKEPPDKRTALDGKGLHFSSANASETRRVTLWGVRVGDGYFNSQNLSLHIGEVVLVSKSENGYEAVTKDGKRLGKLTPYRREGR